MCGDAVLWDKVREPVKGNKLLLSDFRVVGEITLGPEVD